MATGAKTARIWFLVLLCPLAAAANIGLSSLVREGLHAPLFLDTLFTTALTFSAGLLPGIATALLTMIITVSHDGLPEINLFVLCSIAEAVLVWIFRRRFEKLWKPSPAEPVLYSFIAAV
ncbi:MAG: hypothetical protein LBU28_03745, partial [Spirochaetaceae bacterium]|nr:hypothetical protein [Spirochaetaceae bacterium]